MAPRKLPTKKDHDYLALIKQVRYAVGKKAEQHKLPLEQGMLSKSNVRWYLKQCGNCPLQAAWMGVIDRELVLSKNKQYVEELISLSAELLSKHGTMTSYWNNALEDECDELYKHIYNTYEKPRLGRVSLVEDWMEVIDPEEKLYKYCWEAKKKKKAISRSKTRRLLKRVAGKLLDIYGKVEDNPSFRNERWVELNKFEDYIYTTNFSEYNAQTATDILIIKEKI